MGCGQNSWRRFLLTVCSIQLASTALRQVFDFIGFMWLPIIANFFHFIFVIFGFFGAYQYKPKYILIYVIWLVAWVAWNVFVACFYLSVGSLESTQDWLNFGTGSASWWEVNGAGCRVVYPSNLTMVDPYRPLRPERVDGCALPFVYVETIHAALQCLLAIMGMAVSLYLLVVLTEEDEACKSKIRATSIYSVEYSPNTEDSGDSIDMDDNGTMTSHYNTSSTFMNPSTGSITAGTGSTAISSHHLTGPPHPSTMTPRRVKRHHNRNRSSSRSRQPSHPTPETNFANNYMSGASSSGAIASTSAASDVVPSVSGVVAAASVSVPNIAGPANNSGNISHRSYGRNSQRRSTHNRQSGRNRRPQYVNPVTQLMDDSSTSTDSQKIVGLGGSVGLGVNGRLGHSNPMYVHSRPGSLHSLASEPPVERPPSVHSSYSNYHGVRTSLNQSNTSSALTTSNVGAINNMTPGLPFGRAMGGKGLRGSQNSILGPSEQRRTALTNSEIRVPSSVPGGNNSMHGSIDNNLQIQSQADLNHTSRQITSNNISSQFKNHLAPTIVTNVTNISPSSIVSHNTTQSSSNNTPFHLLNPPQQQQLQITHNMVAQQQRQLAQQQEQQLQQQQQQQYQQQQAFHHQHNHSHHHNHQSSQPNPFNQQQQHQGGNSYQNQYTHDPSGGGGGYSHSPYSRLNHGNAPATVSPVPYSPGYSCSVAESSVSPRSEHGDTTITGSTVDDKEEQPPPYMFGSSSAAPQNNHNRRM